MDDKHETGAGFEIVTREDFSDVTFLLEIDHPLMAKAARLPDLAPFETSNGLQSNGDIMRFGL